MLPLLAVYNDSYGHIWLAVCSLQYAMGTVAIRDMTPEQNVIFGIRWMSTVLQALNVLP